MRKFAPKSKKVNKD